MQDKLLSVCDEGAILVTAVFLENGDVLLSGDTGLQAYELDLVVDENITCDQFLGAVYGGLRDTLISRYHLDLKNRIGDLAYRGEGRNPSKIRRAQAEAMQLRQNLKQGLRLRTYAMMYDAQARKVAAMEEKYRFQDRQAVPEPNVLEKMGWIVCWQVFHECYRSYLNGYPEQERQVFPGKSKHCVIARCSSCSGGGEEHYSGANVDKPLIWLNRAAHGDRKLRELGFHSGSKLVFDPVLMRGSPATVEEPVWIPREYEKEQLSHPASWVHQHRQSEIYIDPPAVPEMAQTRDFIPAMLSPLITTGAVVSTWLATGASAGPESIWLTVGTMVASTVAISLINGCSRNRGKKRAIRDRYEEYEQYIRRVIETIEGYQEDMTGFLRHRHPPVWNKGGQDNLINRIAGSRINAFGFHRGDRDFLWVRLGTTVPGSQLVPSGIQIQGETAPGDFSGVKYVNLKPAKGKLFRILTGKVEGKESWGYLKNLPEDLARAYQYVEDAPVGLSLLDHTAVSLLLDHPEQEFQPFLHNVLLDLCCHHRPEDLQVVWFFEDTVDWKERHRKIQSVKTLPHMRQLFQDRSQFVFTRADALQAMDRLGELCEDKDKNRPHVLVIFENHRELQDHPLFETLVRDQGITCWYCCSRAEDVPDRCTAVIQREPDGRWLLLNGNVDCHGEVKAGSEHCFKPDLLHGASDAYAFQTAFTRLALLYESQKRKKLSVEPLGLFRLLMDDCISSGDRAPKLYADLPDRDQQLDILSRELKRYVAQRRDRLPGGKGLLSTLAAPIGLSRDGVAYLDLHQQADGPHLLITDQSGADKNLVLATYLLNLCAGYGPDTLQAVVLSGSADHGLQKLAELPQVTLLNVDTDSQSELGSRRLRTFLQALHKEIKDRKQKLARFKASTVDEYQRALRTLPSMEETVLTPEPIPHQVIVLDDYQVLRKLAADAGRESPFDLDETMEKLIRRSVGLGIHLVIVSTEEEQQLSRVLSGCGYAELQLSGAPSAYGASSRCVVGLFSGNSSIRRQVLIADSGEDLVCRPCVPFRVTLAATQGPYSTFFCTEGYSPSVYSASAGRDRRASDDRYPNRDPRPEEQSRTGAGAQRGGSDPNADPRPEEQPRTGAGAQRGGSDPNADPRPEAWSRNTVDEQRGGSDPNADPRPEAWSRNTVGAQRGGSDPNEDPRPADRQREAGREQPASGIRTKYRPADSVFRPTQSLGIPQSELLIEVLKKCDMPSHP